MSKLVNEQIKKTEILISGLRNNQEVVKKWGINEMLINELEIEKIELDKDNQELERLKTEVREKARAATKKMENLREKFFAIKKIVKRDAEPIKWRQFGVMDKR
ncbi:MAG: hypothetical protein LBR10_10275 [Prevotellaceae bacterium]|jgi:hypothetical protein|nr:hypothetical protein [Prevotellaceae bacterium]